MDCSSLTLVRTFLNRDWSFHTTPPRPKITSYNRFPHLKFSTKLCPFQTSSLVRVSHGSKTVGCTSSWVVGDSIGDSSYTTFCLKGTGTSKTGCHSFWMMALSGFEPESVDGWVAFLLPKCCPNHKLNFASNHLFRSAYHIIFIFLIWHDLAFYLVIASCLDLSLLCSAV